MRWLRYDGRLGSWLGLVALAIQLAVSFGHVHIDSVQRADVSSAALGRQSQAAQSLPAQQPGDEDDDYCAICASIYLASNSFVPQAPQLPVPVVSQPVEHFGRTAVIFVPSRRSPFQSRAPPSV
jgi:Protein of unknown function (DUF2946)